MINSKYISILIFIIFLFYTSYYYLNTDSLKNYFFQKNDIIDEQHYYLDKDVIIKLLNQK
jgi:hypothetical protein